ncbi:MAG: hypothetical protein JWN78_891 [Bacteroidota bacterium]|nr:hypothetical protein [Bacteroidota bacterium]
MKTRKDFMNYGIYIDHKRSFIIALNNVIHEESIDGNTDKNANDKKRIHVRSNDNIKNFCRSIIAKLEKAHRILIFGPAESKYHLQKEIKDSKVMHHISEELLVTDKMEKEEALWFVKKIIPYQ